MEGTIWNAAMGTAAMKLAQVSLDFRGDSFAAALSPDGKYVASGHQGGVAIWDQGRDVTSGLRAEGHVVNAIAFSPASDRIAGVSSMTGQVALWQATERKLVSVFDDGRPSNFRMDTTERNRRLSRQFYSVVFSPNDGGQRLLAAGRDDRVRLWDTRSHELLRTFEGHTGLVAAVAFSPDGGQILTGGWDNTARLWNVSTGQEVGRFDGHGDYVACVAFSPDGRHVLTASWDGTTRLWDRKTRRELCRLIGTRDGQWMVTDPDGRFDTGALEQANAFAWVFPDDPFGPCPPMFSCGTTMSRGCWHASSQGRRFPRCERWPS